MQMLVSLGTLRIKYGDVCKNMSVDDQFNKCW
jgi:hypothetical protein